jgi:ComF family protein
MRAFAAYRPPLVGALLQLKYRPNRRLATILAEGLAVVTLAEGWSPDLVVAVPLGFRRQQSRGYNQVALVAEQLAELLTTTYDPLALTRIRETRTQVGLKPAERRRNVADAFEAAAVRVASRSVLVVDDLTTTGATLIACASALYRAGASEVFGVSVARPVARSAVPNPQAEPPGP